MIQLVSDYTANARQKRKRKRSKRPYKRIDMNAMLGTRVGRLVLRAFGKNDGPHKTFICVCDCGKRKTIRADSLRRGATTSCGCFRREIAKVTAPMGTAHYVYETLGREFNLRTVIELTEHRDGSGNRLYRTRCICGTEELLARKSLRRHGACRSCYNDSVGSVGLSDDDATP